MGNEGNTPRILNVTVAKIGGSLLRVSEVEKVLGKVVERHLIDGGGLVIVVSAMKGVTDALINAYNTGDESLIDKAIEPYVQESERLGLPDAMKLINSAKLRLRNLIKVREPWAKDSFIIHGELLSTALSSSILYNVLGVDAEPIYDPGIITDENWGGANVLGISSYYVRSKVTWGLSRRSVIVMPGFLGMSINGRFTSLGRGGSDYTASLVASYIGAPRLVFYTDVEGLMTGDPRIISDVKLVPSLTHEEAYVASLTGAKKFHPNTFKPLLNSSTRVLITSPWSSKGTIIEDRCFEFPKLVSVSSAESLKIPWVSSGYAVTVVGCVMGLYEYRSRVYEIMNSYDVRDVVNDASGNGTSAILNSYDDAVKLAKDLHRWVVSWIR